MEQFRVCRKVDVAARVRRRLALVGVNTSGNLEVLVENLLAADEVEVEVSTAVTGFRAIWEAVIADFIDESAVGGLRFAINDGGARPDVVKLRLLQGLRLMEAGA